MRHHWSALAVCCALAGCSGESSGTGASAASSTATGTGANGGSSSSAGAMGGAGGSGAGGAGGASEQNRYLYVANQNSDTISLYTIDGDSGALAFVADYAAPGVGPLAVDHARSRMFTALVKTNAVRSFTLDHATGALAPIGDTDLGIRPVYLSVEANDEFLFVASYSDDTVQVHPIASDGTVGAAGAPHMTGQNPHAILPDRSNGFVFVPNTSSDTISQLSFDNGVLTPNAIAAEVVVAAGQGPRHLTFHPSMDLLFVVNEHADSVTAFDFDLLTGTLEAVDTISTLPMGADGSSNTCADIHITSDGKHLYASNRGHDSLAMFAVDQKGKLTSLGQQPTEARPREFEVTPDGRFVYAAGMDSNKLASYRREANGTLTPIDTIDVGNRPMWVLAVYVPTP